MLDKDTMEKIVASAQEEVKRSIIEQLRSQVLYDAKTALKNQITDAVVEFFEEEIKEELVEAMRAEKAIIISSAVAAQEEIAAILVRAMVAKATENLTNYKASKVLKELFG